MSFYYNMLYLSVLLISVFYYVAQFNKFTDSWLFNFAVFNNNMNTCTV